jgi:hypothetical protein
MDSLRDMTQAKWDNLMPSEKAKLRSDDGLTQQLIGLEAGASRL